MVDKNPYRTSLHKRQKGLCWYCGRLMVLDGYNGDPETATIEHLGPDRNQRVLACYECNNAKGRWSDAMTRKGVRMKHPSREAYDGGVLPYRRLRTTRPPVSVPEPPPLSLPPRGSRHWPPERPAHSCHLCHIHGGCVPSYHDCPHRLASCKEDG